MITLGTGVGSGVVIGGRLYTGNGASGVELGHTVIKAGGKQCNCGRKGCFEAYCSATALIESTKRAMSENPRSAMWRCGGLNKVDGKTAFDYFEEDETAKSVVDEYIGMLSVGIVNVSNAFRPERIIIGGGISRQGDALIKPLQKAVDELSFGAERAPTCKVVAADSLNDAGILGAASLVI